MYWNDKETKEIEDYILYSDERSLLKVENKVKEMITYILKGYFNYQNHLEDEIITETFTNLMLKINKYDSSKGTIFNFMTLIILNNIKNYFKKYNTYMSRNIFMENITDETLVYINKG